MLIEVPEPTWRNEEFSLRAIKAGFAWKQDTRNLLFQVINDAAWLTEAGADFKNIVGMGVTAPEPYIVTRDGLFWVVVKGKGSVLAR